MLDFQKEPSMILSAEELRALQQAHAAKRLD